MPNQAARQLRRRKADAVGYVLPSGSPRFADPFFSEFLAGLGDETAVQPFDLLVSIAPPGEEAEKQIYRKLVLGNKVDGLILTHMHIHDWRAQFLTEHKIPFTALENSFDGLDFPRIEVDRKGGMLELVTHLVSRGFRRIAYLGGPIRLKIETDQFDGYRGGLAANQLAFDASLVAGGDLTSSGGYQSTRHLLSLPDPPDAVVCINDETAFGALHAAHEHGRQVGVNFAVAGFDGVQASKYSEPPLTSLDIPVYDIARQLVRMLVVEITAPPLTERRVVLSPKLLVRASTGG